MAFTVVVIGTGFGRYAMVPAFKRLGCEVILVSARDRQAIEKLVAEPCDLVCVHSPPFLHLEHVKLATGQRRNILCDKPFGCDAHDARTMLDLAQSAGVLHFLNFEFRFDTQREKAKALLDAGAIGAPVHLSSSMYLSRGRALPHGWIFDRDQGGGWIGAYASHFVDMLHWLFGDIETVTALPRIDVSLRKANDQADDQLQAATAEDALMAIFRMKSGVTAALDTAFSAAVDLPPQMTLLGSDGAIQLLSDGSLVLHRAKTEPERFVASGENPMNAALDRWLAMVLDAVATHEQIFPDFTTGLECAEVLDIMRASRPW
jgi:predicted dehydrogenase